MRTFAWQIDDVGEAHPNLYLDHCVAMAVALMGLHSELPCELTVHCAGFNPPDLVGESTFLARVAWDEQTAESAGRLWATEQPRPMVERAAVALAALLFARLIPDSMMRVTEQGQRADYWLPLLRCALEVSGTTK